MSAETRGNPEARDGLTSRLPELQRRLAESPGDPRLQEEIRRTRERLEDYRKLRFFPRSTPITGYTVDGEMLGLHLAAGELSKRHEPGPGHGAGAHGRRAAHRRARRSAAWRG